MGFSAKQVQALKRNLESRRIHTREAHGRELHYIEGWYALSEANRIFGFDGWDRETLEPRCVLARESRGTFLAIYIAKVRISVHANGETIIREGHGTGEGRGTSPGDVHDIALKAAETDRDQARTRNVRKAVRPGTLREWKNRSFGESLPSHADIRMSLIPLRARTTHLFRGRHNTVVIVKT